MNGWFTIIWINLDHTGLGNEENAHRDATRRYRSQVLGDSQLPGDPQLATVDHHEPLAGGRTAARLVLSAGGVPSAFFTVLITMIA